MLNPLGKKKTPLETFMEGLLCQSKANLHYSQANAQLHIALLDMMEKVLPEASTYIEKLTDGLDIGVDHRKDYSNAILAAYEDLRDIHERSLALKRHEKKMEQHKEEFNKAKELYISLKERPAEDPARIKAVTQANEAKSNYSLSLELFIRHSERMPFFTTKRLSQAFKKLAEGLKCLTSNELLMYFQMNHDLKSLQKAFSASAPETYSP